jgi:hypothetical protein
VKGLNSNDLVTSLPVKITRFSGLLRAKNYNLIVVNHAETACAVLETENKALKKEIKK